MVDDVVWVQVLNPTLEQKKIYKNEKSHMRKNFQEYSKVTLTIKQNIEKYFTLRRM